MNVTIRIAAESDACAIAALLEPIVRDTTISFELKPPDEDEIGRRIREVLAFAPWLVADEAGKFLGCANGSRFRARAAYRFTMETSVPGPTRRTN